MTNPKSTNISFDNLSDDALIREKQLHDNQVIPFSASTLWRKVKKGEFPRPIKLSDQMTAWKVREIRQWLADPANYRIERSLSGGASHA
jgi:prophage regulatory protein